MLNLTKDKE